jgi:hypothetical protein
VRGVQSAFVAIAAGHAVLGVACATPTPRHEIERLADAALDAAEGHLRDGNPVEAGYLTEAVLRADSDSERALSLLARIEAAGPVLRDPLLGSNRPLRVRVARPPWIRALLYLPDRLLDLGDVASLDLHLGFGLYANAHATRALQAAAGARGVTGIGWHERRSLGLREQNDAGFVLGAFGAEATSGMLSGTSGLFAWAETVAGLRRPGHSVYQDVRDYWAIGAAVTILVIGATSICIRCRWPTSRQAGGPSTSSPTTSRRRAPSGSRATNARCCASSRRPPATPRAARPPRSSRSERRFVVAGLPLTRRPAATSSVRQARPTPPVGAGVTAPGRPDRRWCPSASAGRRR